MYQLLLLSGCVALAFCEVCNKYCDEKPADQLTEKKVLNEFERFGRHITFYGQHDGDLVFGRLTNGQPGDELWIDRSWDFGETWSDGSRLGSVRIPEGATESTTKAYNVDARIEHTYTKVGAVRLCASFNGQEGIPCTYWLRLPICIELCDDSDKAFVTSPIILVQYTHQSRRIELITSQYDRIVYGHVYNAIPGDEIWLDRSWNGGRSWGVGSILGRSVVSEGSSEAFTTAFNVDHKIGSPIMGLIRVCVQAKGVNGVSCTGWHRPPFCNKLCDYLQSKRLSDPNIIRKSATTGSRIELLASATDNAAFGRVVGDFPGSEIWLDRNFDEVFDGYVGFLGHTKNTKGAKSLNTFLLNFDTELPVPLKGMIRACGIHSNTSLVTCTEWTMSSDLHTRTEPRQVEFETCILSIIDNMKSRGDHLHSQFSHIPADEASYKFRQMFCKDYGQFGNCNKCFKEVFSSFG